MNQIVDVIIVGAGPAGLSSAIYTGRARLDTLVIEKGIPGGQILTTDWIDNYPGFSEGLSPFELMEEFRKQTERFGARIMQDEVLTLQQKKNLWMAVGRKDEYAGRALVIATGADFIKLGVPGEAELTGKGVSYCATCDAPFFKNKKIAVVGGGDNALKEAIFLAKFGSSLQLIHRRDCLRGEKILQEMVLSQEKIQVLWNTVIERVNGKDRLESLSIKNVKDGIQADLPVDGLFVSIGTRPNSSFVRELVEVDEWEAIKVDRSLRTSKEGLYAAGDVSDACPKQVATAVGSGVHAAISVNSYLETRHK